MRDGMIQAAQPGRARLILASSSPRRRQLLAEAGYDFEVHRPPIPEPNHLPVGLPPARHAESLAYFKARSVAEDNDGACVLGADTVVAVSGFLKSKLQNEPENLKGSKILGKARDEQHAGEILAELSSARHAVITGVAIIGPGENRLIASETTYVTMKPMTAGQIEQYIRSGEWRGKAGAYAIQQTAERFVKNIEGSFTNVVGLPMELLARMLAAC